MSSLVTAEMKLEQQAHVENQTNSKSITEVLDNKRNDNNNGGDDKKKAPPIDETIIKNLYKKYKEVYPKGIPLVCACEKGRFEDVKLLITGRDFNRSNGNDNNMTLKEYVNQVGTDSDGDERTPLMVAAKYEHFQIVKYLIEQGEADPNIARSTGSNALHLAAWKNIRTNTVELLLNNMSVASINKKARSGETPLDVAYNHNKSPSQQKIIELIRSKGGKRAEEIRLAVALDGASDAKTLHTLYKEVYPKGIPLVCACQYRRFDDVKLLITGHDVNSSDGNNTMTLKEYVSQVGYDSSGCEKTPLMAATDQIIIDYLFSILLDGVTLDTNTLTEVYMKAFPYGTPLVVACEKGRFEDVKLLITGHHDVNDSNDNNNMTLNEMVNQVGKSSEGYDWYTPLMIAVESKHSKIAEYLLEIINASKLEKKYYLEFPRGTPLVCACEKKRFEDVKLLIAGHHDVNDSNGNNNMTLKEYVNQVGKASNGKKCTPLVAAAGSEHFQLVQYLLEQGEADPNIADKHGWNVLHLAAIHHKRTTELIQLLLTHMSLNSINKKTSGKSGTRFTPLDLAYLSKSPIQQEIIDLIRLKGGKRGDIEMESHILDEERLALFESYVDRDEKAAQKIHKFLLNGDKDFIFDICKSIVEDWDMKNKMESVEIVHGGKSGSKIYKVQRKKIAGNVTSPGNVVLSPNIVCIRIDVEPNSERGKLLQPGTFNHVGYMAHTRMRDSQYFPDFHTHPESHKIDLIPDCAVLEYLHGKDFRSRGKGTCPVFDTKEDAAAYGRAVGMLHATTNEQWYEKCTNNRNPFHELKNKLSPRMIKAVENHSRSDEAVLLYRVAQVNNLRHICQILPEVIESLSPNSLMGRVVVAHNDLHDGNILRRHENDKPGDLVFVDFGRCCLMQAGHDLGGYLASRNEDNPGKTRYPTLENRRACAQAYIDATPADVLAKCTRTSVDEVVYDMEVGQLLRDAFIAVIVPRHTPGRKGHDISKWVVNDRMKKVLAITRQGLKEKSIEEKILKIGARHAGGTG